MVRHEDGAKDGWQENGYESACFPSSRRGGLFVAAVALVVAAAFLPVHAAIGDCALVFAFLPMIAAGRSVSARAASLIAGVNVLAIAAVCYWSGHSGASFSVGAFPGILVAVLLTVGAAWARWGYERSRKLNEKLCREIRNREAVERSLREATRAAESAVEAKAAFLANMSHEIRTPLNAVIGTTELLGKGPLTPQQRSLAELALSSSELLLSLVNDILDFSKISAGKLRLVSESVEVRKCVDQVLGILAPEARRKGLELDVRVEAGLSMYLRADAGRLRQVLLNLVGNAVKFTSGGHVWVEAKPVWLETERPAVRLSVSDTGCGIPPERLETIFEVFEQGDSSTTRRFGGTGLGLSISRHLTELMGGRLWASSSGVDGEGSTFHLELPLDWIQRTDAGSASESPVAGSPSRGVLPAATPRPLRILVAEDNRVNQVVAQGILEKIGYQADIASDGRAAVEAAAAQPYDVIFMDVQMPKLDGLEATRLIAATSSPGRGPWFVAMTAGASDMERQACDDAGMHDFVPKPARISDWRAAIDRYLCGGETSPSQPAVEAA